MTCWRQANQLKLLAFCRTGGDRRWKISDAFLHVENPLHLNAQQREAIRAIRKENPKIKYREIALRFGVSTSAICNVFAALPHEEAGPAEPPHPVAQPYSSFIRPIPLHRLMAGRA